MLAPTTSPIAASSPSARRMDAPVLLRALEEWCESQEAGAFVPTQAELMREFGASERSVRWALDELARAGKIISRRGARSSVAEKTGAEGGVSQPRNAQVSVDNRTIVAITQPDRATFDQAIHQLYHHVEAADLSLVCRFFNPRFNVLPHNERPLGYILFRELMLPLARELQFAGHRVVMVGMPPVSEAAAVPNVTGDHEQGGYLATKHLLDLGHRRIAFYGATVLKQTLRFLGHQRAIKEAHKRGLPIEDSFITNEDYSDWKRNHAHAQAFFARPDAPTGIVAWNDHEAVLLLSFLNYLGVRVPEQVSLVGYDHLPEGERVHPALTTVDSAIEHQLQAALKMLTATTCSPHQSVVVLPTLIRRDSSAPIAL